ncbi:MAG TPA: tetratricopeptide repeat protein [Myxococcota bacterium]
MNKIAVTLAITVVTSLAASAASAQNIDKAISSFKKQDYENAAAQFYAVLRFSEKGEEGDIAEAQYGLAKSFEKLGLPLAALKYYEDIAKVGSSHPHFDKAVEGLVSVGEQLDDDLKTPQILDSIYNDQNGPTLQKMNPEIIQRVHFVLGHYAFNRGQFKDSRDFLKTVKPGNPSYPHAQYMLGLIQLGVGRGDNYAPKYEQAIDDFVKSREAIPKDTTDPKLLDLKDLASLALARTYYEQAYQLDDGDPKRKEGLKKSMLEFQRVPRFSDNWAQALFERAWNHTVNNEYGRALGALHSLSAPYFKDEFYPEAKILQSIIYYYNCQWDRVNSIIDETKATYEPMTKQLQDLSASNLSLDEWYPLLQKSVKQDKAGPVDKKLLPRAVAVSISKDPKFMKMEKFLREIDREGKIFEKNDTFSKSDMGREMKDFANDAREAYLGVVGKFLKTKVSDTAGELNDITTRASLVALETKTAEADWLEQGRQIGGKNRVRQPRPFIPDDTFQFWWFRNEYWIDELGYYEFTIKTECFDEPQQSSAAE